MNILQELEVREIEELYININPIQAGGRLNAESRKAIISYADGYSVCDFCVKPNRLDYIQKPPIEKFFKELAKFVNMDIARVISGARQGFRIVIQELVKESDIVIVSALAHYSLCLAIESVGGIWKEVQLEKNKVTPEALEQTINEVLKKEGKKPELIALEHFDYQFGNEHDIKNLSMVAKKYEIPFLYNGAYSVGILPVDGKDLGVDFIVGSGHKSMSSPAPTGLIATTNEFASRVFKTTQSTGNITGRKFGIKEVNLLGCTVMGAPLIAMMAGFPYVKERVNNFPEELEKVNFFVKEFLRIDGNKILSELPRKHTLTRVDTKNTFGEVAKKSRKKGYFLYEALKKRGIVGITPGITTEWKLNTYGLSWEQIKYLTNAFLEIAEENNLYIKPSN